jgi:hypothetical protein
MNEFLDRRVLGALRLQDGVTGLALQRPFHLESDPLVLKRNRQGNYVIFDVLATDVLATDVLQSHTTTFGAAPAQPAVESLAFELRIRDALGDYLPRRVTVRLPRDANPQSAAAIFNPIQVPLYRAPSANTAPNWAVIRATLVNQATGQRLSWALVKVVRNGSTTLAMADGRGEALIAVPGIPVTTWDAGGGAVLATEVDVRLDVVFDPALLPFDPGEMGVDPNRNYIPDPDVLTSASPLLRRGSRLGYKLAAGRDRPDVIAVTLS